MRRVWFIRHGQSEANAGLRSFTAHDIPLTALGKRQAEAVARRFQQAPALIAASPFTRAQQTSMPTRMRFPESRAETWPIQEFTYLSVERCRNTTAAERAPLVHAYWAAAKPDYLDGSDCESFRDLLTRVDDALARVRELKLPFAALFTHGQFTQAAMWRLGAGPQPADAEHIAAFASFMVQHPVPNGAVLEVELGAGAPELSPLAIDHLPAELLTY